MPKITKFDGYKKEGNMLKPKAIKRLNLKFEGASNAIETHQFHTRTGMNYHQLQQYVKKYIAELGSGKAMVTSLYADATWLSGKWVDMQDPDMSKLIFNPQGLDYDDIENWTVDDLTHTFDIFFYKMAGGNSEFNDCLHEALLRAYNGHLPTLKNPHQLKRFLKLRRKDLVDTSRLEEVAQKIGCVIHVQGDIVLTTTENRMRHVYLTLSDGHYTLQHDPRREVPTVSNGAGKLYVYHNTPDGIEVFNGKQTKTVSAPKLERMKKSIHKIVVQKDAKNARAKNAKLSLEEFYDKHTKTRNNLLELSEGEIDLFRWSYESVGTRHLFHQYSYLIPEPEKLKRLESSWIQNHNNGAIIWAKSGTYDHTYEYDIKSAYSAILCSPNVLPFKAGKEVHYDEAPNPPSYGYYECEIEFQPKMERVFRYSNDNTYTHLDVKLAQKLGLKVTMEDTKHNAYVYSRASLIRSDIVFGDYLKKLFQLRQTCADDDTKRAIKGLMSSLWGSLCGKNRPSIVCNFGVDNPTVVFRTREVESLRREGDGVRVTLTDSVNHYRTNWARIGPFVQAMARYRLGSELNEFKDSLVKVHTDGVVSTKPLPLAISSDLGGWKLEVEDCKIKIAHVNNCRYWDNETQLWVRKENLRL